MGSSTAPQARTARWRTVGVVVLAAGLAASTTAHVGAAAASAASPPGRTAPSLAQVSPRAGWGWPLHPAPAVVSEFRAPPHPWSPGHRGVDLAGTPGQQVQAPAAGRVTFAGTVVDRGVLTIEHPGGLRSSLEPVLAGVAVGQVVARGQPVAVLTGDAGHCQPSTCLHWGVRRGSRYVDPLALLRPPAPPVLLPLTWSAR